MLIESRSDSAAAIEELVEELQCHEMDAIIIHLSSQSLVDGTSKSPMRRRRNMLISWSSRGRRMGSVHSSTQHNHHLRKKDGW
jgi:hypothetical protein